MIALEFNSRNFCTGTGLSFLRSIPSAKAGHKFISIFYYSGLSPEILPEIRGSIMNALFTDVVLAVCLDKRAAEWRQVRQTLRVWARYIRVKVVFVRKDDFTLDELVDEIALDSLSRESLQGHAPHLDSPVERANLMGVAVRRAERLNALSKIPYYKGSDVVGSKVRDVQHTNFMSYAASEYGVFEEFQGSSLFEIGPGAGYIYRYAQSKGCSNVVVADKNAGFCALAEIDEATAINRDVTDAELPRECRATMPDGVDYFFAKGVLNVYAFKNEAAYFNIVATVTELVKRAGIWVTYNVDRETGYNAQKVAFSRDTFEKLGWRSIEVPSYMLPLVGLNYLPEVDWQFWLKN